MNNFLPIVVIILTMVVTTFAIFFYIKQDFHVIKKNNPTLIGLLYQQEALAFDDDYAPLVEQLKTFTAWDKDGQPLNLIRHGSRFDGGYTIATQAFNESDVLLGYGIAGDISFEEKFSDLYHKPSFGFDCGVTNIDIKNSLCQFIPQCIASDNTLYNYQKSTGFVSSYSEQIKMLHLENKKVFLKMDIEGAEYDAFEDILKYHSDNITGIALEIHMFDKKMLARAIELLEKINTKFLLVHAHAIRAPFIPMKRTSNIYGCISNQIELSFVNKNLVSKYEISTSQKHPNALDYPNFSWVGELYWEIKTE